MEVKGSSVIPTVVFVKQRFGNRFTEWLNELREESRRILEKEIILSQWYPLKEAYLEPTISICRVFYDGSIRGAWEVGRFSADFGLKNVYKFFLRFSSPNFLVRRASIILPTYFKPSKIEIVENLEGKAKMHITYFPEIHEIIEHRIGGWMERAIELCGVKEGKVTITRSLARGESVTEFTAEWKI